MFTDDYGAKLLIEGIQLEFDVVDTALNRLNGHDPKLPSHYQTLQDDMPVLPLAIVKD